MSYQSMSIFNVSVEKLFNQYEEIVLCDKILGAEVENINILLNLSSNPVLSSLVLIALF